MDHHISRRAESYLEAQDQQFYSEQDVERICSEGRLSSNLAPLVAKCLEHAAKEWFENATIESRDLKRTKADLSRLSKAARRFSEALGGASREAWDALLNASDHPDFAYRVSLDVETSDEFDPGPISIRVDDPENGWTLANLPISDLQHLANELVHLSVAGQFDLSTPGKGRRESHALNTWIRRMYELWDCHIAQPFTAGHMKGGQATTPASAFCVEAFRVLDADMPPQRVHTEMRKFISFANEYRSSQ